MNKQNLRFNSLPLTLQLIERDRINSLFVARIMNLNLVNARVTGKYLLRYN